MGLLRLMVRLVSALLALAACGRPVSVLADATGPGSHPDATADASSQPQDGNLAPADTFVLLDTSVLDGSGSSVVVDAAPDAMIIESRRLGMNDISFLVPLPLDPTSSATVGRITGFSPNGDLIPRDVYTTQIAGSREIVNPFEQFHIVAVRFDLCDRVVPGPCPLGADGQIRLALQPLDPTTPTKAEDVALHATYRIPSARMAWVVNELRALARIRNSNPSGPLEVAIALSEANTEFTTRFRALVSSVARQDNLFRLTVFAQPANLAPFEWHFSGLERAGATFEYVSISGLNIQWLEQDVVMNSPTEFSPGPIADIPSGFVLALAESSFLASTKTEQKGALSAINRISNPGFSTIKNTQCAGCHLATFIGETRSRQAHIKLSAAPDYFVSTHDVSISAGLSATDNVSLRAFGWRDDHPEISQRVANDTSAVLDEIETNFPPP